MIVSHQKRYLMVSLYYHRHTTLSYGLTKYGNYDGSVSVNVGVDVGVVLGVNVGVDVV
jgi:hypothetical protein